MTGDDSVGSATPGETRTARTDDETGEPTAHPDAERTDGGEQPQPYTVRLELVDEPGQLLAALEPIAAHGGNLLSIFHERGNITPRGRIPVEVDLECPPDRFDTIVEALREEGINVVGAGAERYGEELTLLLVGPLVETDLSDTLGRIERSTAASVLDLSLSAPDGAMETASARLRLTAREGQTEEVLATVEAVAEEKNICVIEPLTEGSA